MIKIKKDRKGKIIEKEAEEVVRESKSKIDAILNSTLDGVYATDKDGRILMYNDIFLSLWKIPKKLVKHGADNKILEIINNKVEDRGKFLKRISELYSIEDDSVDIIVLKDGRFLKRSSSSIKQDNKIMGRVWTFSDITEQRKAEEKIWYLSFHDKMTGLYNRAFFKEELKRLNTRRRLPLSIVFCDLNGLKEINNNFGYERGDLLLRKFAEVLKSCFRNEDVVVRWGGDEFAMILPNTNEMDVENIIKRIRRRCKLKSKRNMPLSATVGTATKNKVLQDIDPIVNDAEKRMNANKKAQNTEV